jgi:hypothetical protein
MVWVALALVRADAESVVALVLADGVAQVEVVAVLFVAVAAVLDDAH